MNETIKPILPPDNTYPTIRFYARPRGGHIHSNRNCPMLNNGQFEHYGYHPISFEEAKKQNLQVCSCVNDTLCSHHRLTIPGVEALVKKCGWRQECQDQT